LYLIINNINRININHNNINRINFNNININNFNDDGNDSDAGGMQGCSGSLWVCNRGLFGPGCADLLSVEM